jgi:hypothetical protein
MKMVSPLLLGGVSFVLSLGAVRLLVGDRADLPPPAEVAQASGKVPAQAGTTRSGARPGLARSGEASNSSADRLDVSRLSQIDRAILTDSSALNAQQLFLARRHFQAAVAKWVIKERKACPDGVAPDPSFLRVDVEVEVVPGRAAIARVKSVQVTRGAPVGEEVLSCLADRLRQATPYVVPAASEAGVQYAGEASFLVQVNNTPSRSL